MQIIIYIYNYIYTQNDCVCTRCNDSMQWNPESIIFFAFVNSHAFGNGSLGEQVFVAFHYPPVSLRYVKHCRLPEPLGNEQCPVPWVSEGCFRSKIPDH